MNVKFVSWISVLLILALAASLSAQDEVVAVKAGQLVTVSGESIRDAVILIEDGKITTPVKGATLIGNGPEVMQKISMIGNDMALDNGVGVCGKDGQSVPVGVGQPSLKVDELTVGGTA